MNILRKKIFFSNFLRNFTKTFSTVQNIHQIINNIKNLIFHNKFSFILNAKQRYQLINTPLKIIENV